VAETYVGVAIEARGRIVEVVTTTEEHFSKTVWFMLSRWDGAENLKARRCVVVVEEEVGCP